MQVLFPHCPKRSHLEAHIVNKALTKGFWYLKFTSPLPFGTDGFSSASRLQVCCPRTPPSSALLTWSAAAARGRRDAQGLHSMAQQQRVEGLPFRFLLLQLGRGRNLSAEGRHANSTQALRSYRSLLERRMGASEPKLCFLRSGADAGCLLCFGAALCHYRSTSATASLRRKGRAGKEGKRPNGRGGRALSSGVVTVISGRRAGGRPPSWGGGEEGPARPERGRRVGGGVGACVWVPVCGCEGLCRRQRVLGEGMARRKAEIKAVAVGLAPCSAVWDELQGLEWMSEAVWVLVAALVVMRSLIERGCVVPSQLKGTPWQRRGYGTAESFVLSHIAICVWKMMFVLQQINPLVINPSILSTPCCYPAFLLFLLLVGLKALWLLWRPVRRLPLVKKK